MVCPFSVLAYYRQCRCVRLDDDYDPSFLEAIRADDRDGLELSVAY
jgi:hypothetical protein